MKVLILSCVMGEGHNSAANAMLEVLQKNKIQCELIDTLTFAGKNVSKIASDAYLFTTRVPILFHMAYCLGRLASKPRSKSPVYYGNRLYRYQLLKYITTNKFDTILVTHLFPAEALTALKREGKLKAKTLAIVTDYTCAPFWEETDLDYYVIPHKELIPEFMKRGLNKNKLLPYGIPVKQSFLQKQPKDIARHMFLKTYKINLSMDKPWFLIMSGSMGYGKIEFLVHALVHVHKSDFNIIIICGDNKKLYDKLHIRFRFHTNVLILGFIKDIPLLMDACDILFSKPGGLSSTEAAIKKIPLIHTIPIPGCETSNAQFFSDRGMSIYSNNIVKQLKIANKLCKNSQLRNEMLKAQQEHMKVNSGELIYRKLCQLQ